MQVYVKVTNKNDFPIKDSYDGVEYVILPPPAKPISLPFHVAAHFFGLKTPEDIHNRKDVDYFMVKRWGWNRPEIGVDRSKQLCGNITLDVAIFEMREVETHDEHLPAPRIDDGQESSDEPQTSEQPRRLGRPPRKHEAA